MSKASKCTSHLTPFYLPSPDMADGAEMALWERLHRDVPPRPSTFGADGDAERETTNLPAEIGTGCAGRKMYLVTCILGGCLAYVVGLIVALWVGCIVGAVSALVAAVLIALVLTSRDMPRRAPGGEGV